MEHILPKLDPEEVSLYYQIENYDNSQKKLKELINSNKHNIIELYLIDDDWLNKWKKYSCYNYYNSEDIKNNYNNCNNLKKDLKNKGKKLENFHNYNLIQFDNQNNISGEIETSFKPDKYFHLVTKDCFDSFTEGIEDKYFHIIKYKFESINNKIMAQSGNKVIVLYKKKNKNNLNLAVFVLQNPIYNKFCNCIKDILLEDYLKTLEIDDNCQNQIFEIEDENIIYKIYYINKSIIYNKTKEDIFHENSENLILSLIEFDNYFNSLFKNENSKKIEKYKFYLIDQTWLENLKNRLNYNYNYNTFIKEKDTLVTQIIKDYYNSIPKNEKEIESINKGRNIFNFLKIKKTAKIIKYCINYSLISCEIWKNLKKLFSYKNEIYAECFIIKNIIALKYNDKCFEIFNYNQNNFNKNLLFYFYENQNINNIINDIFFPNNNNLINYPEYLSIIKSKETHKIIMDKTNNNNELGMVININEAIKENNNFKIINRNEIDNEIKFEFGLIYMGLYILKFLYNYTIIN